MKLTRFFPAMEKGDANDIPLVCREDDIVEIWSSNDLETGAPVWIAKIYSANGAASGVPDSTYDAVWNCSSFFNTTDKKNYHKLGTPGLIDGTWTVDVA